MRGPTPDFIQRWLYHFYSTRLKKFSLIRTAKEIVFSPAGDLILFCIFIIPLAVGLIFAAPFLYWEAMREQREYQRLYENRDTGWHS